MAAVLLSWSAPSSGAAAHAQQPGGPACAPSGEGCEAAWPPEEPHDGAVLLQPAPAEQRWVRLASDPAAEGAPSAEGSTTAAPAAEDGCSGMDEPCRTASGQAGTCTFGGWREGYVCIPFLDG
mmetsp:Transcript_28646/g.67657  ORF Transcript_28646/g.67657 Transcript_28646/m.67657 type:complete len:123 (-) Transcript_28646:215-583(-)